MEPIVQPCAARAQGALPAGSAARGLDLRFTPGRRELQCPGAANLIPQLQQSRSGNSVTLALQESIYVGTWYIERNGDFLWRQTAGLDPTGKRFYHLPLERI